MRCSRTLTRLGSGCDPSCSRPMTSSLPRSDRFIVPAFRGPGATLKPGLPSDCSTGWPYWATKNCSVRARALMPSCSMAQGDTILDNGAGPLVRLGWTLVSIAALAAIWHLAATALQSRALPGPIEVTSTFLDELKAGALAWHAGATLARFTASSALAVVIGTAIVLALGRLRWIDRVFDSWLILFLTLPALVVIILCYFWFGLTELSAITSVAVNKIPNFA